MDIRIVMKIPGTPQWDQHVTVANVDHMIDPVEMTLITLRPYIQSLLDAANGRPQRGGRDG